MATLKVLPDHFEFDTVLTGTSKIYMESTDDGSSTIRINVSYTKTNEFAQILISKKVANYWSDIIDQEVLYTANKRVQITCEYLKIPDIINLGMIGDIPCVIRDSNTYSHVDYIRLNNLGVYNISFPLSRFEANRLYRKLRLSRFISRPYIRKGDQDYIINCNVCTDGKTETPKNNLSLLPGRVKEDSIIPEDFNRKDAFIYNRRLYYRIPLDKQQSETWLTKDELDQIKKESEPLIQLVHWLDSTEYDELPIKEYDDFEEAYKICGNYYKFADGHVSLLNYTPRIGCSIRVVSPELLQWHMLYDFDKIWEGNISQSLKGVFKGAYKMNNGDIVQKSMKTESAWKSLVKDGLAEKCVTLGQKNTNYPGSTVCPICKALREITAATDDYLNIFQKYQRSKNS